jgi:hypothetical protein
MQSVSAAQEVLHAVVEAQSSPPPYEELLPLLQAPTLQAPAAT